MLSLLFCYYRLVWLCLSLARSFSVLIHWMKSKIDEVHRYHVHKIQIQTDTFPVNYIIIKNKYPFGTLYMTRWMFCCSVKSLSTCNAIETWTQQTRIHCASERAGERVRDASSASAFTNHISFIGFSCTVASSLHLLHLAGGAASFFSLCFFSSVPSWCHTPVNDV